MSGEVLKPCPFCGGEAEICHVRDICRDPQDWYWGKCLSCHISGKHYPTEAEAIAAWNTRSAKPCYATDHTHDGCKYSVNRGWVENVAHGMLTAEQVRRAIFVGSTYTGYDGCTYHASGINLQEVTDELNSRLESGTCHDKNGFDESIGFECTSCETTVDCYMQTTTNDKPEQFKFCPNCGKAVEQ